MSKSRCFVVVFAALISVVSLVSTLHMPSARADDPAPASAPATVLKDLSWLSGTWLSEGGRSRVEETWSVAQGSSMHGMCRIDERNGSIIYELITIERTDDKTRMYIQHFGPGLKSKQNEPNVFTLLRGDDRELIFEDPTNDFPRRIIYRAKSPTDLLVRLEGERGGTTSGMDIRFKRVVR